MIRMFRMVKWVMVKWVNCVSMYMSVFSICSSLFFLRYPLPWAGCFPFPLYICCSWSFFGRRPLSASSKAGCPACFSGSFKRFCMLSVLGLFQCSLPTLLSLRLSASFLASSSANLDIFLHFSMSSCFDVLLFRYSVTSLWMLLSVSCSVLITVV